MAESDKNKEDELAGTEQPFVAHLMELRDRLLYCIYGLAVAGALLAIWPGPSGLIDMIAVPIKAHMPPDAKLIAVGVFSPFFVPLKVLLMAAVLLALPWLMYQAWMFVAPGLYSHEKKFALPLIIFGSLLAYGGIAFVQFFVLDKMFGFIQRFTPASVAATPDIASYVESILSLYIAFGVAFQVPIVVMLLVRFEMVTSKAAQLPRLLRGGCLRGRGRADTARRHLATRPGGADVPALRGRHHRGPVLREGLEVAGGRGRSVRKSGFRLN